MLDPFFVERTVTRTRRVCSNPLCAKLLSSMNKQELCYACYNLAMMRRSELSSPSLIRRSPLAK